MMYELLSDPLIYNQKKVEPVENGVEDEEPPKKKKKSKTDKVEKKKVSCNFFCDRSFKILILF